MSETAPTPPFDEAVVEGVARVLGKTSAGLTGTEIATVLARCGIPDPGEMTKWRRIAAALADQQRASGSGNAVVLFVKAAMNPVRWAGRSDDFGDMIQELNAVLAFRPGTAQGRAALPAEDGGHPRRRRDRQPASPRRDATAGWPRRGLQVLLPGACSRRLLRHGIRGRERSGRTGPADHRAGHDGHQLVQDAFEGASPMVAFNTLRTDTERNEQRGLANIMKGVFGAFRNPTAHEPRLFWHVREQDALDLLTMISLVHRRLDEAQTLRTRS